MVGKDPKLRMSLGETEMTLIFVKTTIYFLQCTMRVFIDTLLIVCHTQLIMNTAGDIPGVQLFVVASIAQTCIATMPG